MPQPTRWTGLMPIDSTHGQPVQSGDVIATGHGPREADSELRRVLRHACCKHGDHVVSQALSVQDSTLLQFAAWFQAREHASECEVAGAGNPVPGSSRGGSGADGIPLPMQARITTDVPRLLAAIIADPERVMDAVARALTFGE